VLHKIKDLAPYKRPARNDCGDYCGDPEQQERPSLVAGAFTGSGERRPYA